MYVLFANLIIVSFLALVVGLIKPTLVLWWSDKKTRGQVLLLYGVTTIIVVILFYVTAPPSSQNSQTTTITPEESKADKKKPPEGCHYEGDMLVCQQDLSIDKQYKKDTETGTYGEKDYESQDYEKYTPKYRYVRAGTFSYKVSGSPIYREHLGSEYYGKDPGEGAIFLLVPVKIKNNSNETDSLPSTISWEVIDLARDYTYKVRSGADIYLEDENQLDPYDVPPGLTRSGYIVFEIDEDSRYNDLILRTESWFTDKLEFALNF